MRTLRAAPTSSRHSFLARRCSRLKSASGAAPSRPSPTISTPGKRSWRWRSGTPTARKRRGLGSSWGSCSAACSESRYNQMMHEECVRRESDMAAAWARAEATVDKLRAEVEKLTATVAAHEADARMMAQDGEG